jgi:hypothetical protein
LSWDIFFKLQHWLLCLVCIVWLVESFGVMWLTGHEIVCKFLSHLSHSPALKSLILFTLNFSHTKFSSCLFDFFSLSKLLTWLEFEMLWGIIEKKNTVIINKRSFSIDDFCCFCYPTRSSFWREEKLFFWSWSGGVTIALR